MKISLLLLLLCLTGCHFTEGVTFIQRIPIDNDTTFTQAASPHIIDTHIVINPGAALTVEPGCEIIVMNGGSLRVKGGIRMEGTEQEPIQVFVTPADSQFHIVIATSVDDNSVIRNTKFNGNTELAISRAFNVDITSCFFKSLYYFGISDCRDIRFSNNVCLFASDTIRNRFGCTNSRGVVANNLFNFNYYENVSFAMGLDEEGIVCNNIFTGGSESFPLTIYYSDRTTRMKYNNFAMPVIFSDPAENWGDFELDSIDDYNNIYNTIELGENYSVPKDSKCIDAGNPDPLFNDTDGTRSDIGIYGGPTPFNSNLLKEN